MPVSVDYARDMAIVNISSCFLVLLWIFLRAMGVLFSRLVTPDDQYLGTAESVFSFFFYKVYYNLSSIHHTAVVYITSK